VRPLQRSATAGKEGSSLLTAGQRQRASAIQRGGSLTEHGAACDGISDGGGTASISVVVVGGGVGGGGGGGTVTSGGPPSTSLPPQADCCAICLSDYAAGDTLRTLPCAHMFHQACVDLWLRRDAHCPLCKQVCTLGVLVIPCQVQEALP
jgi:hypothetical protein